MVDLKLDTESRKDIRPGIVLSYRTMWGKYRP